MPEFCTSCGQSFLPEPDFYYGAMYISYGIGVFLFLTGFYTLEKGLHITGYLFLFLYISCLMILWPIVFRYSRTIYIYIFIRFDKEASRRYRNQNQR